MPSTFPSPFPAHQGLIMPLVRRWPNRFDVIALSVGAAMPDFVDISLGYLVRGYFRQWYGHALIFIPFNVLGGILLTWLIALGVAYFSMNKATIAQDKKYKWRTKIVFWGFSVTIGVLSHLGFDLIAHDTNFLLYPWYENPKWFPEWWYVPWFKILLPHWLGSSYSVGLHTVVWVILSALGTFLFYQFVFQKNDMKSLFKKEKPTY